MRTSSRSGVFLLVFFAFFANSALGVRSGPAKLDDAADQEDSVFCEDEAPRRAGSELQTALEALLENPSERRILLDHVEAAVDLSWETLPKVGPGRVAPEAVRHLARRYLARIGGWYVAGLEGLGMLGLTSRPLHDVALIHHQAPAARRTLKAHPPRNGLSKEEAVAFIAAVQKLILEETRPLLEAAYNNASASADDHLDERGARSILETYMLGYKRGAQESMVVQISQRALENNANFVSTSVSAASFIHRRAKKNQLKPQQYHYSKMWSLAKGMIQKLDDWTNDDCLEMKSALRSMDPKSTGRVPLKHFYAYGGGPHFNFRESEEHLRIFGALDETIRGRPQVIIANYVHGPSNCIAPFKHFRVCCVSDCYRLMDEIESQVGGETATPKKILKIVANMSSAHIDAGRKLPQALLEKLYGIAANRGGEVLLHSRLFAQWVHYAFPFDCLYPVMPTAAKEGDYKIAKPGKMLISPAKREEYMLRYEPPTPFRYLSQWSDVETNPFELKSIDKPQAQPFAAKKRLQRLLPKGYNQPFLILAWIGVLHVTYGVAMKMWRTAVGATTSARGPAEGAAKQATRLPKSKQQPKLQHQQGPLQTIAAMFSRRLQNSFASTSKPTVRS